MADGKGECCIARWGEGHVAEYNTSKMDMIMLKFRPIAPKPVEGMASTATENSTNGPTRHAKLGRGRKKSRPKDNNNNNNNNNHNSGSGSSSGSRRCNNNGRKRKSSSPDHHQKPSNNHHHHHQKHDEMNDQDDQKADLTLLPLFPEEPDLMSPTSNTTNINQVHNLLPFYSLSFDETDNSTPTFEGNYNYCHQSWR